MIAPCAAAVAAGALATAVCSTCGERPNVGAIEHEGAIESEPDKIIGAHSVPRHIKACGALSLLERSHERA